MSFYAPKPMTLAGELWRLALLALVALVYVWLRWAFNFDEAFNWKHYYDLIALGVFISALRWIYGRPLKKERAS